MKLYTDIKQKILSGDNLIGLSDLRYLPRWVVLLLDLLLLLISLGVSYFILRKLGLSSEIVIPSEISFAIIVAVNIIFMFVYRTYAGIIRHSTFIDLLKIFLSTLSTIFLLLSANFISYYFFHIKLFHTPIVLVYAWVSFGMQFLFRLSVKLFFNLFREVRRSHSKKRILVLGIGVESVAVARAIIDNPSLPYYVVGFMTERRDSKKAKLLGKRIFTKSELENGDKEDFGIDGVLIIRELVEREELNALVGLFLEKDLQIFKSPSVQKLRKSDMSLPVRNLQIEDLLNRKPIKIDNEEVRKRHFEKSILVTGGAGSIGSEIVRQVAQFQPSEVVVLDQAETPLYEIELEVRQAYPNVNFKFVMLDVANKERLEALFQKHQFSMVYHAAAYKHVPLVETNPHEAIFTNVQGSKNLACLASKYKINRFVMVSTDKAVNPTNVMGATKRTAELFVQSLQNIEANTTKFITTRFGNVLGSNGSVIPLFKKQIEKGGPITITHPDIVRYFMTIPEACELVLQAGTMGQGGEVFVFDMGAPVKIVDLAKRMIKLSGFEVGADIEIIYTGLRPGEKLYEELLNDEAKTLPTHNEKIMISKDPAMDYNEINLLVDNLINATKQDSNFEVVKILKKIVPEFKSKNSIYEQLD